MGTHNYTNDDPNGFFTAKRVKELLDGAETVGVVDFAIFPLEDQLSIPHKISEATSILLRKGARGHFWVLTSPEIYSLIYNAVESFLMRAGGHEPLALQPGVTSMGILGKHWRIFVSPEFPTFRLLIGADFDERPMSHYARLSISNYFF